MVGGRGGEVEAGAVGEGGGVEQEVRKGVAGELGWGRLLFWVYRTEVWDVWIVFG